MRTELDAQRIAPVEPPYTPRTKTLLDKWMPPGSAVEPLRLFRTLAVHEELASRMRPLGAGILGHGHVDVRDREIMIDRTCARAGAEYEWGVHVMAYGNLAGLTDEQIAATASGAADDPAWPEKDSLLIRLADELHETCEVSDELWAELSERFSPEQLLELLVIAGQYRLISYIVNGARVELEEWGARFPQARQQAT